MSLKTDLEKAGVKVLGASTGGHIPGSGVYPRGAIVYSQKSLSDRFDQTFWRLAVGALALAVILAIVSLVIAQARWPFLNLAAYAAYVAFGCAGILALSAWRIDRTEGYCTHQNTLDCVGLKWPEKLQERIDLVKRQLPDATFFTYQVLRARFFAGTYPLMTGVFVYRKGASDEDDEVCEIGRWMHHPRDEHEKFSSEGKVE